MVGHDLQGASRIPRLCVRNHLCQGEVQHCNGVLAMLQSVSKAEKAAKEEERRQADLRSYKGVMTVSSSTP